MESKMVLIYAFILISASSLLNIGTYAATYNVGDDLGWTFLPSGAIAYRTWTVKQNFIIGDTLVFNFTTGQHNVAEVSKANYDSCNAMSPISISNNGPTNMKLDESGEHYYICTYTGHCDAGMKLAINVFAPSPNTRAPKQPTPVSGPSSSKTHMTLVVGDALGWTFPPLGAIAYRTWAAKQNFVIGDTLVFNFTTGQHNVAEVSKTNYDSCNTMSPISISNNGPTNMKLDETGKHYYICTYTGHCDAGMKLAINVFAPSPNTRAPKQPTPVSGPSSSKTHMTLVVGDALGWTFPPLGAIAYRTWAAKQNFVIGDTLVFNFTIGEHNVAEVSKANYDSCNIQSPISISNNGPSSITLNRTGEHYYICTYIGHCGAGMKLAINVSAPTTTTPSPQQPAPVSGSSLSRNPMTLVVGDVLGWTFPPLGAIAYRTWSVKQNFVIGDTLVFNFTTGQHNVAEVNKASYDSCNTQSPIFISNNGPTNITLNETGKHYYICTYTGHCNSGMKLTIIVSAPATTNLSPQSPAPVSAPQSPFAPVSAPTPLPFIAPTPLPFIAPTSRTQSPATSPSRTPTTYVVGDAIGWTVPPGGPIAYQIWANDKTFVVGDTLVFKFTTGQHNVAQVTSKIAYDSCNTSAASILITNGPASIILTTPGEHLYFCIVPQHCNFGQKLAINVTGVPSTTANGSSGSSTTTPSSSPALPPSVTANGPSDSLTTPPSSSPTLPPSSTENGPSDSLTTTPSSSPTLPPSVTANGPSDSLTTTPSSSPTLPPSVTANGPSDSLTTTPSSSLTLPPSTTANGPSDSSTTTPSSSALPPSSSVPLPSPSSASIVAAAIPFALLSITFTLL